MRFQIKSICDIPTAQLTAVTFKDWKVKAFSGLRNQQDAARDFQQKIHAFQARLENEAAACIRKWAPLLAECSVEVTRDGVLNDVLQSAFFDFSLLS
jgi:hypothetical protein